METLSALLEGPRARGAFLLRSVFRPPWSLRIEDRAPVSLVTMVRGSAWLLPDSGAAVVLRPGDVALVRGPDPYTLADEPGRPPQVVVGPDQRCRNTASHQDVTESMALGVRSWGESGGEGEGPGEGERAVMLSGTYRAPSEVGRRLLDAMPSHLVERAEGEADPLVGLLAAEMGKEEPGQELVLDRLLDLLFLRVVRSWLATPDAPGWHRAQVDPVVGPTLRAIHEHPERGWTVSGLAAHAGVSRSVLARRFAALVGEPPMAYLAGWRLTLAADLLRDPDTTVGAVAHRVGYGSGFALSTAFKRVRGVSPAEFRAGAVRR